MFAYFPDGRTRFVYEMPSKEYLKGWGHHFNYGFNLDANPHPKDSEDWWEWFYGMRDAQEEAISTEDYVRRGHT